MAICYRLCILYNLIYFFHQHRIQFHNLQFEKEYYLSPLLDKEGFLLLFRMVYHRVWLHLDNIHMILALLDYYTQNKVFRSAIAVIMYHLSWPLTWFLNCPKMSMKYPHILLQKWFCVFFSVGRLGARLLCLRNDDVKTRLQCQGHELFGV